MPLVEIDELELQQNRRLRSTVEHWMKNPKAARKLMEAQKIVDPTAKIPELDEPDPLEAVKKEASDQIAALQKRLDDEKAERERDSKLTTLRQMRDTGIAKLREKGWMKDGIEAVEKIMEEKGILDPLDAAAIFERDHPPAQPLAPMGSGPWNFAEAPVETAQADDKYVDQLLKAGKNGISDGALMSRVQQTLNDQRGAGRR